MKTKNVLLLKLSSLGDLIHTFPALSDAMHFLPGLSFDWVVDASFQEVANWHPAVRRTHITNHRVWRHQLFRYSTICSIYHVLCAMRQTVYDEVIDAQGNFKTALIALCSKGPRSGFDRDVVREWIAHFAYQKRFSVPRQLHAIVRLRRLFSLVLGYPVPLSVPDFQMRRECFVKPKIDLPSRYLCFIHSASWKTKLWPQEHWVDLILRAVADGWKILLPWGSIEEKKRADRLAVHENVFVLPKLTLSEIGYILMQAQGCVSVDTGLSHLASALQIPLVALYGPTNPKLIGVCQDPRQSLACSLPCVPCQKKMCQLSVLEPICLQRLYPKQVYQALISIMEKN